MGKDVINWESGVGIWGLNKWGRPLVFSIEIDVKIHPWLKGVESLYRLISFFSLLGTYVGIRLRETVRSCKKDLIWPEIPIVTGDQGDDYIIKKNYTTSRPTSWVFQELDVHNLATNLTAISRH